jgi:predicted aspartyl protease
MACAARKKQLNPMGLMTIRRFFWILASTGMLVLRSLSTEAEVRMTVDPTGHLSVPVFVNGKGPYEFTLDTGADSSAVYAWFASEQRLEHGHAAQISGATGDSDEITTRINALSLDGRVIHGVDADTLPDRPDGTKIAGVAGVDLLMERIAILDTGCDTLSLLPRSTDPGRLAGPGAVQIQAGAIKDGKQLTLPLTVNDIAGVATLDTGAGTTIINNTFAKAAGIDPASSAFKEGRPARGATQKPMPSRVGPIGTVKFAGLTRENVVARIIDLPVFDDEGYTGGHALNLGVDLLRDIRITIDYSARRIWLANSLCAKIGAGS